MYYTNGNLQFSYTIPTPKSAVTAVASENAKVSFQLYSGASEVTVKSLVQVPTSAVGLSEFNYYGDEDYQIKLKGFDGLEVSKLTINGTETEYTLDGTIMTVAQENMPKLDSDTYQGVVTTTDAQELAFNVIYDNVLDISDTGFVAAGESKTLNVQKTAQILGSAAVGYNNTIRFAMKANKTSGSHSNIGIGVGDLGFYAHGNGMRILTYYNNSVGQYKDGANSYVLTDDDLMFGDSDGNPHIFELKVALSEDKTSATISLKILSADGTTILYNKSRSYTPTGTLRDSANAMLVFAAPDGVDQADYVTFTSLKNPAVDITPTTEFNRYGDSDYTVTIGDLNGLAVKSLTVNGTEVEYSLNDDNTLLTVARENMPELANGTYTAVMKFTNPATSNDSSVKFNITYENILDVADLGLELAEDGSFTLTATNTTTNATTFASGTAVVGYNTKVTFDLQNTRTTTTTTDSETGETTSTVTAKYNDGLFLGIGSYGVNLLAGYLRPVSKSSSSFSINWGGTSNDSLFIGNNGFVSAARKVVMWVTLESDTTAYVNVQIYNSAGTSSKTYKVPVTRILSEIASENAKFTVGLMNDSVASVTLK